MGDRNKLNLEAKTMNKERYVFLPKGQNQPSNNIVEEKKILVSEQVPSMTLQLKSLELPSR